MYGFHFIQMTSLIGAVVFVDGQALYENKCINHEHYGMFYICSHHITNTQTHTYTHTLLNFRDELTLLYTKKLNTTYGGRNISTKLALN